MSIDNERDDCCFKLDLTKLPPESDSHDVERWPYEDFMRAFDETSRAMDKTLAQIIPLLCRKYSVSEAMIRLVLAKVTMSLSVVLEADRLGLMDDHEIGDCISHLAAVLEEHRRPVKK